MLKQEMCHVRRQRPWAATSAASSAASARQCSWAACTIFTLLYLFTEALAASRGLWDPIRQRIHLACPLH